MSLDALRGFDMFWIVGGEGIVHSLADLTGWAVAIWASTQLVHVLLANERPDWGKEKQSRRDHVAKTHRVIMLVGDDYGDFVFCSRAIPVAPCTVAATRESRAEVHDPYMGFGRIYQPFPQ